MLQLSTASAGQRRVRDTPIAARVRFPGLDPALVALPIIASLFNAQLGPLTPLTIIASVGLISWLRWPRLPATVARCWPIFALGLLVLISAVWSIEPRATLRYGTLYMITITLGILIATAIDGRALLSGLFVAFAIFNIAAVIFGRWVPLGISDTAFAGLSQSKNMAGQIAGFGLLISVAALPQLVKARQRAMVIAAFVSIAATLLILVISRSSGAQISTAVAGITIILWFVFGRFSRQARTLLAIILLLIAALALASWESWFEPLFQYILESTGKDPGLTGRDLLWQRADELIAQRPWVGVGYGAFWRIGNLEAEGLWRYFGIATRSGFNFHNTPREILVHLGYVGLAAYACVMGAGFFALVWRTIQAPNPTRILFFAIALYLLFSLGFEVIGFNTMHFITVLGIAAVAKGLSPEVLDPAFDPRRRVERAGTQMRRTRHVPEFR